MKTSTTKTKLLSVLRGTAVLLFWILLWGIAAAAVDRTVLLPSPYEVLVSLGNLWTQGAFWLSIVSSLFRILIGYGLGCVLGILLAVLCFRFRVADALLSPFLSVIRAVPVASFIILALVWIGKTQIPAFISLLMVLPIITGNVRAGLRALDPQLYEVAVLYRFAPILQLRTLWIPCVRPYFTAGAETAIGLAWKAGVAAEVLTALPHSIGGGIYDSKLYLETETLFAWTLTVIVISMLIERILFASRKKREEAAKL